MTTPTADAIRLAVKLSGHSHCQHLQDSHVFPDGICEGCMGDAATIDAALLLPAKHAALFAAQVVVDASLTLNGTRLLDVFEAIRELSQSLKAIKTK